VARGAASYLDWLLRAIDSEIDGAFGFTDGQATATWDVTPAQSIRATVITGRSTYTENDETPGPNTLDRATNRSAIVNLQWRYVASPRVVLQQQAYVVDAAYRNTVIDGRTREEGSDREITWRGSGNVTLAGRHGLDAGGQIRWERAWRVERSFTASASATTLHARESWSGGGAWLHYRWTARPGLILSPGVRADWSGLTRDHAVSPYLLAEWQVAPAWRLRAGTGRQHQFAEFDQSVGGSPAAYVDLGPQRAWTADAGVAWQPGRAWRVRLDGYYREERDRLRFEGSEFRTAGTIIVRPSSPYWANSLRGSAAGGVVTLEGRRANGLSGWVSLALGRTDLTDTLTGERFVSDYDQARTLNAYGIYRTSRRMSLSARYRYGSNFPLAGYYAQVATDVWALTDQRNEARLPAYSRLDLRADWAFTYRRSRLTLFTEIVNTTVRRNLGPDAPSIRLPRGTMTGLTQTLFPLLPSVGVLVEF
jgi:outer membrane receptor for ferrienterochelin and colicin